MKRISFSLVIGLGLLSILAAFTLAHAATVTVSWTGDRRATHYRIERLEDVCAVEPKWIVVADDIPQPAPFPLDSQVFAVIAVPDKGVVLLRGVAFDDDNVVIRTEAGAWYNFEWTALKVGSLGVK